MKRIAVFAALAASIMVLPSTASAITDCSHTDVAVTPNIGIENDRGVTENRPAGHPGADQAVGVCVDNVAPAQGFHGGYVEAGFGMDGSGGQGVYAVIDGDDQNTFISTQGAGYFGISTFESSPPKGNCTSGTGSNSGGCFQIRDTFTVPVALPIACGNTTGPSWPNAGRDGCVVP